MALSDNASLCLTSFIHRLAEIDHTEDNYKELIQHTLLEFVRRGLKSKTEVRQCYLITYLQLSSGHQGNREILWMSYMSPLLA